MAPYPGSSSGGGSGAVQSYLLCAINGPSRFPGALPAGRGAALGGGRASPRITGKRCLPTTGVHDFARSHVPADWV